MEDYSKKRERVVVTSSIKISFEVDHHTAYSLHTAKWVKRMKALNADCISWSKEFPSK